MWKTSKNIILNNVDYFWKTINTAVLSDNISKVVSSEPIEYANAVAICPCVAELMFWNTKKLYKMQILANFCLKTLSWGYQKGH